MFKAKVLTLIAAMTVSMSAQAGLAQYTFQNVGYNDGSTLTGYFIQDEATRAIVHWSLEIKSPLTTFRFIPEYGFGEVSSAFVSHYVQAPTNFTVFQRSSYPHVEANFNFAALSTPGLFHLSGSYRSTPEVNSPFYPLGQYIPMDSGSISHSLMNAAEVQQLKEMCSQMGACVAPFIPTPMPEPGSIVLLGLAAAGLYSVRRRKVA